MRFEFEQWKSSPTVHDIHADFEIPETLAKEVSEISGVSSAFTEGRYMMRVFMGKIFDPDPIKADISAKINAWIKANPQP